MCRTDSEHGLIVDMAVKKSHQVRDGFVGPYADGGSSRAAVDLYTWSQSEFASSSRLVPRNYGRSGERLF